jgi:hypothetical protein
MPALYITKDIHLSQLTKLANGTHPAKLWLLTGLPDSEVSELALYAASQVSEHAEVIRLNSYDAQVLGQLESAKRDGVPIIITGAHIWLNEIEAVDIPADPLFIAAQDHVQRGHPVFLVADCDPDEISPTIRSMFMGRHTHFAGFEVNLAAGPALLEMINQMCETNFQNKLASLLGLYIAGPKQIRQALEALNSDREPISLAGITAKFLAHGVRFATTKSDLDAIRPRDGEKSKSRRGGVPPRVIH